MKRLFLTLLCSFYLQLVHAQDALNENEIVLFAFELEDGRTATIISDNETSFLQFRLSKNNQSLLEFPTEKANSVKQFAYGFYFRGGGVENESLDLNQFSFKVDNLLYVVFMEFSSADNKTTTGLRVYNKDEKLLSEHHAKPETVKGTLIDMRDLSEIPKAELIED